MIRAAIVAAALFLAACNGGGSPRAPGGVGPVTLDARNWDFRYGTNTPKHPETVTAGFAFDFPGTDGEIDYLMTDTDVKPDTVVRVRYRIDVTGEPIFVPNGCESGGRVSILLQRKNDNLTAKEEDKRFWGTTRLELARGEYLIEIPMTDLTKWTQVFGKKAADRLDGWKATINNLGAVGLTFGGCGHAGHGVHVEGGTARMTVAEFTVE